MIGILNLEEKNIELYNFLINNDIDCQQLSTEDEILNCKKLIIPDCTSIREFIKLLNKKNIYQCIKMLKKDILFIGNSVGLLCSQCSGSVFPPFCIIDNIITNVVTINDYLGIDIISNNDFIKVSDDNKLYFGSIPDIEICPNTIASIKGLNKTAILHKDNFYGFTFLPEKPGQKGLELLKSFINK